MKYWCRCGGRLSCERCDFHSYLPPRLMVLADIVPIEVRNAWETARWEKEIGNLFQEMMTNGQGWAKCYSDDEGCVSLVNLPFDYYTRMYGWELERRVEAATPDVVEWPRQAWVWLLPGNGWLVGQF